MDFLAFFGLWLLVALDFLASLVCGSDAAQPAPDRECALRGGDGGLVVPLCGVVPVLHGVAGLGLGLLDVREGLGDVVGVVLGALGLVLPSGHSNLQFVKIKSHSVESLLFLSSSSLL